MLGDEAGLFAQRHRRNILGREAEEKGSLANAASDFFAGIVIARDGGVTNGVERRRIRGAIRLIRKTNGLDFDAQLGGPVGEDAGIGVDMHGDFAAEDARGSGGV